MLSTTSIVRSRPWEWCVVRACVVGSSSGCANSAVPDVQVGCHPNVVTLHEVAWDVDLRKKHSDISKKAVLQVQELIMPPPLPPGITPVPWLPPSQLFNYVELGPFPEPIACHFFLQLMTGELVRPRLCPLTDSLSRPLPQACAIATSLAWPIVILSSRMC